MLTRHTINTGTHKQDINSNKCQNVRIQRGRQKMTQVQESRLGLGLFILESCEKDELIAGVYPVADPFVLS